MDDLNNELSGLLRALETRVSRNEQSGLLMAQNVEKLLIAIKQQGDLNDERFGLLNRIVDALMTSVQRMQYKPLKPSAPQVTIPTEHGLYWVRLPDSKYTADMYHIAQVYGVRLFHGRATTLVFDVLTSSESAKVLGQAYKAVPVTDKVLWWGPLAEPESTAPAG